VENKKTLTKRSKAKKPKFIPPFFEHDKKIYRIESKKNC
jgi:hypothetical protein